MTINENRLKEVVDFVKNEDLHFVRLDDFLLLILETDDSQGHTQSLGRDCWQTYSK